MLALRLRLHTFLYILPNPTPKSPHTPPKKMLILLLLLLSPTLTTPTLPPPPTLSPHRLRFLSHSGLTNPNYDYKQVERLIRHGRKYGRGGGKGYQSLSELIQKLKEGRGRRHDGNHNITWPLKRVSLIEGDVWLGGLMMVHEREDEIICGPIMPQGGIQALETMLFTIDTINTQNFLPGFTLGAHILDDCDKDTYGLEQSIDFIRGSISTISSPSCSASTKHNVIFGVVGAASSVTSVQVANLLRLFKIPQVSYFSTSPELSNKQRFEFFSRTIPSDKNQVKVMVELVKEFGWSFVSIVYEESNYGIKAFEELEKLLPENNVCIAAKEKLVKDSGVAGEAIYERIVDRLINNHKARGVIIFASDQEVKDLMRAVGRRNLTGHFSWIGSDGWSARSLVSEGNEAVVEGTLSVQPRALPIPGFDTYFYGLRPLENSRNPWFVEFWEHHFECKFPDSPKTPYNQNWSKLCTGEEEMKEIIFEDQLQYVSDAVMSFAWAVRDMHTVLCNSTPGLCPKMIPIDGPLLLNYLRKVRFVGLSGDHFHFDEHQDGPARYNIIHFRRNGNDGGYHWVRVGEYNEGTLVLNMSEINFPTNSSIPPKSICSEPCLPGEAKQYYATCCWNCIKCGIYYIVDPMDESECYECPMGTLPDLEHMKCEEIKEKYLRVEEPWAIFSMTFSSIGLIITTTIILIFSFHNDTPVVRASSRELSYVILSGLFGCFGLTFLFVVRPTNLFCGLQLFFTGFFFTLVYAALLTKTNRIARIFKAGRKSAKRPSFISPRSQLCICGVFCVVQTLITTMWLLISPPHSTHFYPTRSDNLLICESYINHSYIVAFFYPLLIIIVCTVYAVLTRKIPGDFNESKCIGLTMYTTCIIWLAFVPIYFSTGQQVALRITSMTISISLSAYVMIVCLFGPKLYIILFHPEKNVRASMITQRTMKFEMRNVDVGTQFEVDKHRNLIHPHQTSATQTENCECELAHRISFRRQYADEVVL